MERVERFYQEKIGLYSIVNMFVCALQVAGSPGRLNLSMGGSLGTDPCRRVRHSTNDEGESEGPLRAHRLAPPPPCLAAAQQPRRAGRRYSVNRATRDFRRASTRKTFSEF